MTTALAPIQTRKLSQDLLAAIGTLEVETRRQAEQNLGEIGAEGPGREAAILAEQLAVLGNEVGYAHARLRGEILAKLEAGELYRFHPSSPQTLEELADDKAGLSKSETSDLLAWEQAIYPYLLREFNLKPFEVWQRFNKTKRRRLTPILRTLIDPDHRTRSDRVRSEAALFRMTERGRVTQLATALGQTYDEWLNEHPGYDETRQVVFNLLNLADTLTTNDLEERISPEHAGTINMLGSRHPLRVLDENGEVVEERNVYFVWFEADEAQITLLRRRFRDRLDLRFQPGEPITRRCNTAGGSAA
jgi:hypothetical protein